MATYYVLAKSLWQGDTFSPIAGGFSSKQEAQKVAEAEAHDGWSDPVWSEQHQAYWSPTQDLKRVVETIVVSKTAMKRDYGWSVESAEEEIYRIIRNKSEV